MTHPPDPEPAPPARSDAPPAQSGEAPLPGERPLDAYVRQNHLHYSEAALRHALLTAGNPADDVERALARYRSDPAAVGARRRTTRLLVWSYVGVFALLSAGMIANVITQGGDFGSALLSVGAWAIVAAIGYGLSMIWVSSRRSGLLLGGLVVGALGLLLMGGGGLAGAALTVVGLAMIAAALVFGPRIDSWLSTSTPLLLSVPLLILLALGGACVASGLPIPRG